MRLRRGQLRIIGGEWRSRRVHFADDGHVRPTPDRVRQTLFDWLAPLTEGARVLDVFAGSGALGLEALSRGAAHCTFLDTSTAALATLRESVQLLHADDRARCVQVDSRIWLRDTTEHYDVVFLDPPYASSLLAEMLPLLPRVLRPTHRVYLEWPRGQPLSLPSGAALLREKTAGQVSYGLASFAAGAAVV